MFAADKVGGAADRHHSYDCKQWRMVLIGNLGGKLKTNRFLEFPWYGANGHRTTRNCFLSLLDAVGDRREKFGAEDFGLIDMDTTGPLSEISV